MVQLFLVAYVKHGVRILVVSWDRKIILYPLGIYTTLAAEKMQTIVDDWPLEKIMAFQVCMVKISRGYLHWIGLRENLQETMVFTIKYGGFL